MLPDSITNYLHRGVYCRWRCGAQRASAHESTAYGSCAAEAGVWAPEQQGLVIDQWSLTRCIHIDDLPFIRSAVHTYYLVHTPPMGMSVRHSYTNHTRMNRLTDATEGTSRWECLNIAPYKYDYYYYYYYYYE
jgi:hypothetical protein